MPATAAAILPPDGGQGPAFGGALIHLAGGPGPAHESDVRYLRDFAGQLRQKIVADSARPQLLLTEPGVGYRIHGESTAKSGQT